MNITILLAIACGLIFFTLLAIMVIAVVTGMQSVGMHAIHTTTKEWALDITR